MMTVMSEKLLEAMQADAACVDAALARLLPDSRGSAFNLFAAMRHGALGGGKRLRPFLLMRAAALFGFPAPAAAPAAAALEMVHAYSLVHDDLPAMDNDDLRRGRPTVHRAFDEATAILAGDALLTRAFEILAPPDTHPDPAVRLALVAGLARAAGPRGMVAGQALDLAAQNGPLPGLLAIVRLQRLKTGRLIEYACQAGALLGGASAPERAALGRYARALGLAFQIADDLLDSEGQAAEAGKATGKDAALGKATLVSRLGADAARAAAVKLAARAAGHLAIFAEKGDLLRETARFAASRRR